MKAAPVPIRTPRARPVSSSSIPIPAVTVIAPSPIAKAATRNVASIMLVLGAISAVTPRVSARAPRISWIHQLRVRVSNIGHLLGPGARSANPIIGMVTTVSLA